MTSSLIHKLMNHRHRVYFGMIILGLFLGGCSAEEPQRMRWDLGVETDAGQLVQPPGCPDTPTIAAPTIEVFPNPTNNINQPFRGKAIGASDIIARVGGAYTQPVIVDSDTGSFCIQPDLLANSLNTIEFIPRDEQKCFGQTTTITAQHFTASQQSGSTSTTRGTNVAKGKPMGGHDALDKAYLANPSALTDDQLNTSATINLPDADGANDTCDASTAITLDLGQLHFVSEIEIHWDTSSSRTDYAKCFQVFVSAFDNKPGRPEKSNADWTAMADETGASSSSRLITVGQRIRWVSIVLFEDGYDDQVWTLSERFRIRDVKVFGGNGSTTAAAPITDRCQ